MDGDLEKDLASRSNERDYRTDSIIVFWEPSLCIHATECIRGLPRVFNPRARPWVRIENASADAVADVVARCPSGALAFRRLDGGPEESVPDPPEVYAEPNGPLHVRGHIRIEDQTGELLREMTRATLCRCGHSANKPFCDLTHIRIGFHDR
jgi:uncharacterized Fe-S cluster protein YjdI